MTWKRLETLATTPRGEGGVDLFPDGSPAAHAVFSAHPSVVIEGRPETDRNFLRFLRGKEDTLAIIIEKDVEQRNLTSIGLATIQSLKNLEHRAQRSILCEVVDRCLSLAAFSNTAKYVAKDDTWKSLIESSKEKY